MNPSIETILSFFTNREWAFLFLIVAFVFYAFWKTPRSTWHLIKCACVPKLLLLFGLGVVYQAILVFGLWKIGLWDTFLIKETIFLILTSTVIVGKSVLIEKNPKLFRELIISNIKATSVMAYIVNLYSYNFCVELLLLVTLTFFTIISVFAESFGERGKIDLNAAKTVINFSNIIIVVIYLIYFYGCVDWIISNWIEILELNNIKILFLPIVMNILILPFLYSVSLYSIYEQIFTRLRYVNAEKNLHNYKKRRWWIIRMCGLNLKKVTFFNKNFHTYWQEDNEVFKRDMLVVNEKYKSCETS